MAQTGPDQSKPGWQQRAVEGLSTTRRKAQKSSLHIDVPWQFKSLLAMAAKRRGISQSGYMRRAIAAFVAQDLEMQYKDVLKGTQFPYPGVNTREAWASLEVEVTEEDEGQGYGDWKNLAL